MIVDWMHVCIHVSWDEYILGIVSLSSALFNRELMVTLTATVRHSLDIEYFQECIHNEYTTSKYRIKVDSMHAFMFSEMNTY
mgnify:CR=1 FL=1